MSVGNLETVWVFNGENSQFPSGVFSSRELAQIWISEHALTGVLTEYPVDIGVFDWAVRDNHFVPKRPDQSSSKFVGSFTSVRQAHVHFESGSER